MHVLAAITLLLHAYGLSLAAPTQTCETVKTDNGAITGHRSLKVKDVWEYLGIPYAQPPLGALRFAAPQEYKGKGPYTAAEFVSLLSYVYGHLAHTKEISLP
jgi:cholinesterase